MSTVKCDIEIAREAKMKPIMQIGKGLGIPENDLIPYGHTKAKVTPRLHRQPQVEAQRQADPRHRHQPHPGGRRQDHDHGRPRRRPQPHRQEGHGGAARALARPLLRHEGRRGRRRLCPGRADGGHQPAFHGRLPRHHLGAQPALGDDRQPHLLGQRARHRHPPRRLAARDGHERPRAARDRQLARRRRQRLSARGRLRHHGRLRGHGHPLPRRPRSRTSSAASARSSSPTRRTRRRSSPGTSRRRAPWPCC